MSSKNLVFVGLIVSSESLNNIDIYKGFLHVENGKITRKGTIKEYEAAKDNGDFSGFCPVIMTDNQFLMPGLVDCHTHAPQFPNIGLGMGIPLLEWLDRYTFPLEKKYSNITFASKVYDRVVQRLLQNGTTTACYFGTIHLEGTLELVNSAIKHHQRALVGKVSMNLENSAGYYNDVDTELKEVEDFVQRVLKYENDLVQPVITPRFAVSCDHKLMSKLSEISRKYYCRIQSHISENVKEIEHVLNINPGCDSYTAVYDKSEILNERCIMAHAIHLSDEEIGVLVEKGVSIAHCPASNTRLKSGLCPVKRYLEKGMDVGLGTDVSGGDNPSILDAMRRSLDVSTHLELLDGLAALTWKEVFFLATLGGAKALKLDDKIGNFEIGKEFDALLIDIYAENGPIDKLHELEESGNDQYNINLIERFLYLGDDRNIVQVYVQGHKVKDIL